MCVCGGWSTGTHAYTLPKVKYAEMQHVWFAEGKRIFGVWFVDVCGDGGTMEHATINNEAW